MLKKMTGLLILSIALTGCGTSKGGMNNLEGTENTADLDAIPHHDEVKRSEYSRDNSNTGFVRYKKEDMKLMDQPSGLNREELAHSISSLILKNGGYEEAAVLVTDQEVLIGYKKQDKLTADMAKDTAVKTARSAVPSFYRIYATDDPSMMNDIESLHNSKTNRDIRKSVEQITIEMEQDGKMK